MRYGDTPVKHVWYVLFDNGIHTTTIHLKAELLEDALEYAYLEYEGLNMMSRAQAQKCCYEVGLKDETKFRNPAPYITSKEMSK